MISTSGASPDPLLHRPRGAHDRAHLHLVDLGVLQAEPAAARAEHRVGLAELLDPAAHRVRRRVLGRRQELVERRVEQADGDREARHRLEDPLEVGLLDREEPVERGAAGTLVAREDHLLDDGQPVRRHEHVLRPAEADPLGAELAGLGGVLRRVGVRPHAEPADRVGPAEDGLEVLVDRGRDERHRADDHAARAAVDREVVALAELDLPEAHRACAEVDRERLAARHARLAHAAGDDRRVRGHAAVRGEDAARVDEAVDVVGRRLPPDEQHGLALATARLGEVRVEHDRAGRRSRGRVEPRRDHVDGRVRVDHRVEQLVELAGVDARDGLLARDEVLLGHLGGDPERGPRRPLPRPGLEQEERPLLDGELDVLHLAVVLLEPLERRDEAVRRRPGAAPRMCSIGSGVRMPATTSSPWALTRNSP